MLSRTRVFETLNDRQRLLLRSIYDLDAYAQVLPQASTGARMHSALRRHLRFSLRCPARLQVSSYGVELSYELQVVDISLTGMLAECAAPIPQGTRGRLEIDLGQNDRAVVEVNALRRQLADGRVFYGFAVHEPDEAWRRCVQALASGRTQADLSRAPPPPMPSLPLHEAPPQAQRAGCEQPEAALANGSEG